MKASITHATDELRRLVLEHPDYPILVTVDGDSHCDDYSSTVCENVHAHLGEYLEDDPFNDDSIVTSRDDLEERIRRKFENYDDYKDISDEEFDKAVEDEMKRYDDRWKNCIYIYATN